MSIIRKKKMVESEHEQMGLFLADIVDVAPKSEMVSMEHPIFSLSKKRDLETYRYEYPGLDAWVEVIPAAVGRATIFDKDLLLYCIGQVAEGINRGRAVSRRIHITAYEFFMATERGQSGGSQYKRLHNTLARLRGTTIKTNIARDGSTRKGRRGEVFGLIDDARIVEDKGKTVAMEITLSERIFAAISEKRILTYSREYFRLSSANERRMYELCRKHCGNQTYWEIRLENLHAKFGSKAQLKEFRRMIRKMVERQAVPGYVIDYEKNETTEIVTVVSDKKGDVKALFSEEMG